MDTNNSTDKDVALVRKHLTELGEHFDSVQIFVTRHESGVHNGTVRVDMGTGNWFARFGQVSEFIVREKEQSRINVQQANLPD